MDKVVLRWPAQSGSVGAELVQAVAVGFMLLNDRPERSKPWVYILTRNPYNA